MFALFSSGLFFGQIDPFESNLSPNGVFDNVFDQYGIQYRLKDIIINKQSVNGNLSRSSLITCATTSYFDLYFEVGCGMENVSDPVQNNLNIQRRNVICKVFEDISNFIQSPLTGTPSKVNIWVRNINNTVVAPNTVNNVAGKASGFYVLPNVNNNAIGGIIDNEIWKTIHLGADSYANVAFPLAPNDPNAVSAGTFYHGLVAFNFNTNNTNTIDWNLDLNNPASSTQYDLYSVALHEITHALGFASLINENGNSRFGANFNYFSRYDQFLKNNDVSTSLLTSNSSCNNTTTTMYNYGFNNALSSTIIHPNPNSLACNTNTICLDALQYVGTNTVPVHTPNCHRPGSSLSHFEDQIYPDCITPHGNDNYFVMSDARRKGTIGTMRFFKPEERNVLCDLGYNVNTSFGSATNTNFNSPANYYGNMVCNGINVAGMNDGRNADNTFAYIGNQGVNIFINGADILSNDTNAVAFECLEDMTTNTALLASGTSATVITFNSNVTGTHLLRYVPVSSAGILGNITYVFVYVMNTNNCGIQPAPVCDNLVINGGFEQISSIPNSLSQLPLSCGWNNANQGSPDLLNRNSTYLYSSLPCNNRGFQETTNSTNNNTYVGLFVSTDNENFYATLASPLLPETNYQLTFDVSLADGVATSTTNLQAYLSPPLPNPVFAGVGNISIPNNNMHMLQTASRPIERTDGWDKVSLNFRTTIGGETLLYLGDLLNAPTNTNFQGSLINSTSCNYTNYNNLNQDFTYYYLDNVRLVPIYGSFTLPNIISCSQPTLNLMDYVQSLPTNGTFTLTGQPNNSGATTSTIIGTGQNAEFNINNLISGLYTISYNYTNNMGCLINLTSDTQININVVTPIFDFGNTVSVCEGDVYPILPNVSNNGIEGQWTPSVNNSQTTTYTFTPNNSVCATMVDFTIEIPLLTTITGAINLCVGGLSTYTADEAGGIWSVSNPDFAAIDPNSGKLEALQLGSVEVIYTVNSGGCEVITTFGLNIIDNQTSPTFSFPTVFCAGSTIINLPTMSDNGIPGTWLPPTMDMFIDKTYKFIPSLLCLDAVTVRTDVIDPNDTLVSNNDDFYFVFNSNSNLTTSVVVNDTFNGNPVDLVAMPLNVYISTSSNNNITMNPDGTLNLPSNLQAGVYNIVYKINNNCIEDNSGIVTITVYNPLINALNRIRLEECYNPNAFTTNGTIFSYANIGGVTRPLENLIDISNFTAMGAVPPGFSINANGSINVPANCLPGGYCFTVSLCPTGSQSTCVNNLIVCLDINTRVRANTDTFRVHTNGTFPSEANNGLVTPNIIDNDNFEPNCWINTPANTRPPARLNPNANVTLIYANFVPPNQFFSIDSSGRILINSNSIQAGNYNFEYKICDAVFPNDCSTEIGWVTVLGSANRGTINNLDNQDLNTLNVDYFTISPNPSEGIFFINSQEDKNEIFTIRVFNVIGQLVYNQESINSHKYELDLLGFSKGNYLLKVESKKTILTRKINIK